jgi:putative Mn2+ efflux pump MntP
MLSALLLAIALAMDATAVAAARGLAGVRQRDAVLVPLLFGAFQAAMAAIGWLGGRLALRWIEPWGYWVSFGLLTLIGGRMVFGAVRESDEEVASRDGGLGMLLLLSVATSIDALAAGLTLEHVGAPPPVTVALIGGVTAALSAVGYLVGRRLGDHVGARLELVGGVALIAIGVKIVVEHLA